MVDYDDNGLIGKVLLRQAGNKSKIKSWMKDSLRGEGQPEHNASTSSNDADEEGLPLLADDENTGIGAPQSNTDDDSLVDRQLSRANEALRKKLLSGDAYQRYQQKSKNQRQVSKPLPKQQQTQQVEDESEEEGKGRSRRTSRAAKSSASFSVNTAQLSRLSEAGSKSQAKKRPGGYLDQLLAERSKKKTKTPAKREDG